MSGDDLVRNIERIPELARELEELHRGLAREVLAETWPLDRLLTASQFLTEIHRFIVSVPEVVQRARVAGVLEGIAEAAHHVREMGLQIERGAGGPLRAHTAVLRAAEMLDSAADKPKSERPKPKLVIN